MVKITSSGLQALLSGLKVAEPAVVTLVVLTVVLTVVVTTGLGVVSIPLDPWSYGRIA